MTGRDSHPASRPICQNGFAPFPSSTKNFPSVSVTSGGCTNATAHRSLSPSRPRYTMTSKTFANEGPNSGPPPSPECSASFWKGKNASLYHASKPAVPVACVTNVT